MNINKLIQKTFLIIIKQRGISIRRASEISGINHTRLDQILYDNIPITLEEMSTLCNGLQIDFEEFLNIIDSEKSNSSNKEF